MKKKSIVFLFLMFSLTTLFSQESVEQLFNNYIQSLNNLNEDKDIDLVLKYFDTDYTYSQTFIGLKGKPRTTEGTLEDLKNNLLGLISDQDININLKVNKLESVTNGDVYSTVNAYLVSNVIADGKEIEESSFYLRLTARKDKVGGLKFVFGTSTWKLEKKSIGNCFCRFYERDGDYITELIYPNGFEYSLKLHSFKFRLQKGERLIVADSETYLWNEKGEIIKKFETDSYKVNEIKGAAIKKKDAVTAILKSIYKQECLRVVKR